MGNDGHTPQTIRNLVNLMAANEDLITKAVEIGSWRQSRYCQTVDPDFLDRINKRKPRTNGELAECWYNGSPDGNRYSSTRYRMLNLHSYFSRYHTIEFRCFNFDEKSMERLGGLHAGQLKSMIQFCLAMSAWAIGCEKNDLFFKPTTNMTAEQKERLMGNVLKNRLGLRGKEFKTCRLHLTAAFRPAEAEASAETAA